MHGLVLDIYNGPRSDVNMLIGMPYATLYLLAIAMFATSVTVFGDINSRNVPDLDIDL